MKITVNNQELETRPGIDLHTFLIESGKDPARVLVAVNGDVINQQDYPETKLTEHANLDLMAFVGGG